MRMQASVISSGTSNCATSSFAALIVPRAASACDKVGDRKRQDRRGGQGRLKTALACAAAAPGGHSHAAAASTIHTAHGVSDAASRCDAG